MPDTNTQLKTRNQAEKSLPPTMLLRLRRPLILLAHLVAFAASLLLSFLLAKNMRFITESTQPFAESWLAQQYPPLLLFFIIIKLPVFGLLDKVVINRESYSASYHDSHGPIVDLRSPHPNPTFEKAGRYFQAFVSEGDEIYIADLQMNGVLFEHQDSLDTGQFWSHPFFRGIQWEGSQPGVYLQMMTKPGQTGQQLYYRPEKYR